MALIGECLGHLPVEGFSSHTADLRVGIGTDDFGARGPTVM